MKGLGFSVWGGMYWSIASMPSGMPLNTLSHRRWSVMPRKRRSAMFIHDPLVGVKYV